MSERLPIRLLGTKAERGRSFERIAEIVLDRMGYGDIHRDTRKTGAEVDLTARHRITGQPIIAECKGYDRPVQTNPVKTAFGQFSKEHEHSPKLIGVFFSLNGYDSTCSAWYNELSADQRDAFLLKSGDDILSIFQDAKLLAPADLICERVFAITENANLELHLAVLDAQMYWVVVITDASGGRSYSVLDNQGCEVPRPIAQGIEANDPIISGIPYLRLTTETALLEALLDGTWRTLADLTVALQESESEVRLHLGRFADRHMVQFEVCAKRPSARLTRNPLRFAAVADALFADNKGACLVASDYAREILSPKFVADQVKRHLGFELDEGLARYARNILLLSPSALARILGDVSEDRERTVQFLMDAERAGNPQAQTVKSIHVSNFLDELTNLMLNDIRGSVNNAALEKEEITGWSIESSIRLATNTKQYMTCNLRMSSVRMLASGPMQKGDVACTDPVGMVTIGNISLNLGLFEDAAERFEQAARCDAPDDVLAALYNNLALCHLRAVQDLPVPETISREKREHLEAALDALGHALAKNSESKEAWFNRGLAKKWLNMQSESIQDFRKALELDPQYASAAEELKELEA